MTRYDRPKNCQNDLFLALLLLDIGLFRFASLNYRCAGKMTSWDPCLLSGTELARHLFVCAQIALSFAKFDGDRKPKAVSSYMNLKPTRPQLDAGLLVETVFIFRNG